MVPLQLGVSSPENWSSANYFDIWQTFVLDTKIFSSIIYILYDGDKLNPSVVPRSAQG